MKRTEKEPDIFPTSGMVIVTLTFLIVVVAAVSAIILSVIIGAQ